MFLKRISNEIKFFKLSQSNYKLQIIEDNLDNFNTKSIELLKNNKLKILFKISNQYPFRAPYVYIPKNNNLIEYNRWNVNNGFNINNYIEKFNLTEFDLLLIWLFIITQNSNLLYKLPKFSITIPQECFCCSSILCNDKWHPNFRLTDIFIEYYLRNQFFTIIKSQLTIKYIKVIFNNDKWDLSQDIILHILKFLL